jgi:hypothetical protein
LDLVRVMATGAPVEVKLSSCNLLARSILTCGLVQCARINDVSGTIMLCRGPEVALFTLNGDLLLEQHICAEGDEMITACAFYEGAGHEYMQQSLVFTGHRRGVVNVWISLPLLFSQPTYTPGPLASLPRMSILTPWWGTDLEHGHP